MQSCFFYFLSGFKNNHVWIWLKKNPWLQLFHAAVNRRDYVARALKTGTSVGKCHVPQARARPKKRQQCRAAQQADKTPTIEHKHFWGAQRWLECLILTTPSPSATEKITMHRQEEALHAFPGSFPFGCGCMLRGKTRVRRLSLAAFSLPLELPNT